MTDDPRQPFRELLVASAGALAVLGAMILVWAMTQ